jgi:hypothetical protein
MNYIKKQMIMMFLLPIAMYGNNADTQAKIKELKDFGYKKRSELVDLGIAIAERKVVVTALYQEFCGSAAQEDTSAAGEFSNKVQAAMDKRKNIAQVVTTEFEDGLDDWKIFIIRVVAEKLLIESLIAQYAECFQDIVDNDKALDALQQIL